MPDKKKIDSLIQRIFDDDDNAFEELYYLLKGSVFSFAYSICGNWHTAEDVLQDTFIRIKQYSGTYRQNTNPSAWILTIAKSITLNKIRYNNHFTANDPDDYINSVHEEDRTSMIENRVLLEDVLRTLNDTERQVVILHSISDMKHSDIARVLDKPYGTVLWTYSNALKKLKRTINK